MPDPRNYDLNYRPINYWGPQKLETHVGSRTKGELRRQLAIREAQGDQSDFEINIPLTPHPWQMGGEYLPDLKQNEVEIARIVMKSTTMDVISIRARKTKNRIIYRIVDEYEAEDFGVEYFLTKKSSLRPLKLRDLIKLIDNAVEGGLVGSGRDSNFQEAGGFTSADEIYDFETAHSQFYPELEAWYGEANDEWLTRMIKE
jgi:hypothetical protein